MVILIPMRRSKFADLINKYSISPFKLWEDQCINYFTYTFDFNIIIYSCNWYDDDDDEA